MVTMKIDLDNGKPIYLQIIDYLKMAILSGRYRDGDRIPPVRELAMLLRINPNTVAKAYKIMQDEGMLASRPGGGSFIVAPETDGFQREREQTLRDDIARLLDKADKLGITREQLLEIMKKECGGIQP
jgi:GntR family transcriptional regulator